MKCPLSNYVMERESGEDEVLLSDCLKEECAWWDAPVERCLLQNVSEKLSFIYLELNAISGKLGRGGQR